MPNDRLLASKFPLPRPGHYPPVVTAPKSGRSGILINLLRFGLETALYRNGKKGRKACDKENFHALNDAPE